jgi:hypothetical protein
LRVNTSVEKTLKEIYMGRTNGKCTFDVVPDGQADVQELQPTKWAMTFFLDGNLKETFWRENQLMREDKSTYGSGFFYTGIRSYKDWRFNVKKGVEVSEETDLLDEKNFEKTENESWFFFPKRIHPKDFFIDDAAYGQPDVQYANDCIFKEKLSAIEFNERYASNPAFKNTENVTYWQDITPKNKNDKSIEQRQIIVYHYYHRITKKYIIFINEAVIIFNGRFLYDDGKLPFENIQHYTRADRFIGEGIPERVFWMKAYKSEIWQDILNGASMSSGIHLLAGNDDQIGQDWQVGGRSLNIWRTTGGAESVQQINTSPNLTFFTTVLDYLDREITTSSGIDPRAQIESSEKTLGQQELVEANRAVRNSSVDENYNIGLDNSLTMMLSRIKQFAPAVLSKKIYDKSGNLLKVIFPSIRIDGMRVEKKKNEVEYIQDAGKYGYFELKPDVIKGLGVKIVTASTNSILPILEREKFKEYVNNYVSLVNVALQQQSQEMLQKIQERCPIDQIIDWMNDAYHYDQAGLKASTKKDEITKKNREKIRKVRELITNSGLNAAGQPGTPT